jgi:CBS-domain-containing membrane protein
MAPRLQRILDRILAVIAILSMPIIGMFLYMCMHPPISH